MPANGTRWEDGVYATLTVESASITPNTLILGSPEYLCTAPHGKLPAGFSMNRALIFNIQRYSVQDGPGIRTTVFMKGCPLACWWCHNPESQQPGPELLVVANRCIHCGQCEQVCPTGAQTHDQNVRAATCTRCGQCVEACPSQARQMAGHSMTVDEVLIEILKDRIFYDQSGGGVTFSGGEPFTQSPFLLSALKACRDREIHTAVDTCGYTPWEHLALAAPLTSLFLYDLKVLDDQKHRQYTGVSNELILENLLRLNRMHRHIWIRIPLIPGLNDSTEDLDASAEFIQSLEAVRQVNLLPYHPMAQEKFVRLGKACPFDKITAPSPDDMLRAAERFRQRGLLVQIGG